MSDLPTFEAAAATLRSRWVRALEGSGDDRIAAFSDLAASYWYCVYAWWRRSELDAADADAATLEARLGLKGGTIAYEEWREQAAMLRDHRLDEHRTRYTIV